MPTHTRRLFILPDLKYWAVITLFITLTKFSNLSGCQQPRVLVNKQTVKSHLTLMLLGSLVTEPEKWSQHFARPPLVSSQNNVWETSAEIPYWWSGKWFWLVEANFQPIRSTTQVWVVMVISIEFLHSFLRCHFVAKLVVGSRNVSCFLRLLVTSHNSDNHAFSFLSQVAPQFPLSLVSLLLVPGHPLGWHEQKTKVMINYSSSWTATFLLRKNEKWSSQRCLGKAFQKWCQNPLVIWSRP